MNRRFGHASVQVTASPRGPAWAVGVTVVLLLACAVSWPGSEPQEADGEGIPGQVGHCAVGMWGAGQSWEHSGATMGHWRECV